MVVERALQSRDRMRNICFTLNNPTDEEKAFFNKLTTDAEFRRLKNCRYIVYQQEIGVDTATVHLQGYIELFGQQSVRQIKTKYNARMHIERRRGSQQQAIDYCKKQDTRDPNGPSGTGGIHAKTTVSGSLIDAIANNASITEIADAFPDQFMKHASNIEKMVELKAKPRDWAMKIDIYFGDTGVGKSYTAHVDNPDAYYGSWPAGGRWWWPRYEGQETVILDEFRHQIKMDQMLQIMDRYPMKVEFKGGNTEFRSKHIVITTNICPRQWYPGVDDRTMLWRRLEDFCTVWKFEKPASWQEREHVKTYDEIIKYKCVWDQTTLSYIRYVNMDDNQGYESDLMDIDDE